MNEGDILVSAVRYVHAIYDIELVAGDKKLEEELKEQVFSLNDPVLMEYWQDYKQAVLEAA
ncbi:MAG: hypothetical protein ACRBHB_10770 [Arenicella sp.]